MPILWTSSTLTSTPSLLLQVIPPFKVFRISPGTFKKQSNLSFQSSKFYQSSLSRCQFKNSWTRFVMVTDKITIKIFIQIDFILIQFEWNLTQGYRVRQNSSPHFNLTPNPSPLDCPSFGNCYQRVERLWSPATGWARGLLPQRWQGAAWLQPTPRQSSPHFHDWRQGHYRR